MELRFKPKQSCRQIHPYAWSLRTCQPLLWSLATNTTHGLNSWPLSDKWHYYGSQQSLIKEALTFFFSQWSSGLNAIKHLPAYFHFFLKQMNTVTWYLYRKLYPLALCFHSHHLGFHIFHICTQQSKDVIVGGVFYLYLETVQCILLLWVDNPHFLSMALGNAETQAPSCHAAATAPPVVPPWLLSFPGRICGMIRLHIP